MLILMFSHLSSYPLFPYTTLFRSFIARGNVIDLAVAVIIGAAFGKIVTSLVDGIIMPPIGLLLGKVDFSNLLIDLSGQDRKSTRLKSSHRCISYAVFCLIKNNIIE